MNEASRYRRLLDRVFSNLTYEEKAELVREVKESTSALRNAARRLNEDEPMLRHLVYLFDRSVGGESGDYWDYVPTDSGRGFNLKVDRSKSERKAYRSKPVEEWEPESNAVDDDVMAEVDAWQARPVESMYTVVWFYAPRVQIGAGQHGCECRVCVVVGVSVDGTREVLGFRVASRVTTELSREIVENLKARGLSDILIAVTDDLVGMPAALAESYPEASIEACVVQLCRASVEMATQKDCASLAMAMRQIMTAATAQTAEASLRAIIEAKCGPNLPSVVTAWQQAWEQVIPAFAFPRAVRRIMYGCRTVDEVGALLRKSVKGRRHFPSEGSAIKLIWGTLREAVPQWDRPLPGWESAVSKFSIHYGRRFTTFYVALHSKAEDGLPGSQSSQ